MDTTLERQHHPSPIGCREAATCSKQQSSGKDSSAGAQHHGPGHASRCAHQALANTLRAVRVAPPTKEHKHRGIRLVMTPAGVTLTMPPPPSPAPHARTEDGGPGQRRGQVSSHGGRVLHNVGIVRLDGRGSNLPGGERGVKDTEWRLCHHRRKTERARNVPYHSDLQNDRRRGDGQRRLL